MTTEELRAEVERLTELNHALASRLIGMSDRLQESAREIAANAWDEGADSGWEASGEGWNAEYPGHAFAKEGNPYRQPLNLPDLTA